MKTLRQFWSDYAIAIPIVGWFILAEGLRQRFQQWRDGR